MNIVIVDDDIVVSGALKTILEARHYRFRHRHGRKRRSKIIQNIQT